MPPSSATAIPHGVYASKSAALGAAKEGMIVEQRGMYTWVVLTPTLRDEDTTPQPAPRQPGRARPGVRTSGARTGHDPSGTGRRISSYQRIRHIA